VSDFHHSGARMRTYSHEFQWMMSLLLKWILHVNNFISSLVLGHVLILLCCKKFWSVAKCRLHVLIKQYYPVVLFMMLYKVVLRWLHWIFYGVNFPTLNVTTSALTKISEKGYQSYIRIHICYDPCFIDIRVAMATKWFHYVLYFPLYFSVTWDFFRNCLRELVSPLVASIYGKVW